MKDKDKILELEKEIKMLRAIKTTGEERITNLMQTIEFMSNQTKEMEKKITNFEKIFEVYGFENYDPNEDGIGGIVIEKGSMSDDYYKYYEDALRDASGKEE